MEANNDRCCTLCRHQRTLTTGDTCKGCYLDPEYPNFEPVIKKMTFTVKQSLPNEQRTSVNNLVTRVTTRKYITDDGHTFDDIHEALEHGLYALLLDIISKAPLISNAAIMLLIKNNRHLFKQWFKQIDKCDE